ANRKVRQPLAEAAFSVGNLEEQDVIEKYAELLEDELNVKKVRALDVVSEAVDYTLKPLPKQLGQKYGGRFPAIQKKILEQNPVEVANQLLAGQNLYLSVDGQAVEILPEEVEVRAQARAGFAVASEGGYLAALVTDLTPELAREGLAREVVRRVQDLRKQSDLDIADRINIYYEASSELKLAVEAFKDYIMGETLALNMTATLAPQGLPTASDEFDGEKLTVSLEKAR
ncbi:MAG: isoleucine--tRNA ligase, partial [Anaerolineaceae bacterium]|nr:isoleucine--tRNA ligase [Anaerolineaceae bacterium]